ncbi:ferredoxin Fer [Natranaeroarchaeum sulfidigenes]|uniref:DnaJ-like chaperone fused to ferredoxin n=1 Tax=Natranaeroarchaeum sulfidigenes TaxID=2784880 RepID=A0A897MV71_9EURY|nr:ferredoxin Fer [Natranaeroarchaeum sulfidigenes]QSG02066.1 DnaJ-like chaperone fused to ferredoxin [Natranaeroarchaeum sulfidigenes]
MASPYDILGVTRDADEEEVLDAYRERVKETHPDHGGSARAFQAVKTAYERIEAGEVSPVSVHEGREAVEETDERPQYRVEFLNYERLDEHDWSLDDEDLFEKAADANLGNADYGEITVEESETLLEAAENAGLAWPFACRGGACSNCAVAVIDGEVPIPTSHVLTQEMIDRGIRLSCITTPVTEDTQVVFNVKHMPAMEDLLLSESRFNRAYGTD